MYTIHGSVGGVVLALIRRVLQNDPALQKHRSTNLQVSTLPVPLHRSLRNQSQLCGPQYAGIALSRFVFRLHTRRIEGLSRMSRKQSEIPGNNALPCRGVKVEGEARNFAEFALKFGGHYLCDHVPRPGGTCNKEYVRNDVG